MKGKRRDPPRSLAACCSQYWGLIWHVPTQALTGGEERFLQTSRLCCQGGDDSNSEMTSPLTRGFHCPWMVLKIVRHIPSPFTLLAA